MKRLSTTRSIINAALAAVMLLLAGDGERAQAAGVATGSFGVAVRANIRCAIIGVNVVFPSTYTWGQPAPLDAVGAVSVGCDAGRRVSVRLGQGLQPQAASTARNPLRRMRAGTSSNYLTYNLYEDAAHTIVWDDNQPGVKTMRTFPVSLPIYGRIDAGQPAVPGLYTDVIVATLFF